MKVSILQMDFIFELISTYRLDLAKMFPVLGSTNVMQTRVEHLGTIVDFGRHSIQAEL